MSLDDVLMEALVDRARSPRPIDMVDDAVERHSPLAQSQLIALEQRVGVALPASVREVYSVVGNGGFGPGYGLIGLVGGFLSDLRTDVESDYLVRRGSDPDDPGWFWPEGMLAICHWGCAIYSCVDCSDPAGPVVRFDPNPVDLDWNVAWGPEVGSFEQWLRDWLRGDDLFLRGVPRVE